MLIQAKKIQKARGLPKDFDVSKVCRAAGISRKTGYQWADKETPALRKKELSEVVTRLNQLESEHEELQNLYDQICFENEGRKLAWEIHRVEEYLELKKNISKRKNNKK